MGVLFSGVAGIMVYISLLGLVGGMLVMTLSLLLI